MLTILLGVLFLASPWQGPIPVREQFPLALSHASFKPETPDTLEAGAFSTRLAATWSNTFALKGGNYLIDAESGVFELGTRMGIAERLELGLDVELFTLGGGILDHSIDQFHDTFHLPQGSRDQVRDDQFVMAGINSDGSSFLIDDSGTELGGTTVSLKYLLAKQQDYVVSLLGQARLATDTAYGQGSNDGLLAALGAYDLDGSRLYGGVAYTYIGDENILGVHYARHQGGAFLGWEYPLANTTALLLNLSYATKLIEDLVAFPDMTIYFDVGLKHRLLEQYTLELLLREDPSPGRGTTDVSLLVAVSRHD